MPLALFALMLGTFGIGTTEFTSMGLLPEIARGTGVTLPEGGHLISVYALGVLVGAPLVTALGTKLTRKTLLLATMGIFTLGHFLSAIAPSYPALLATRFLSGFPHGAFFGVSAVVAASLVDRTRRARAVSVVFLGFTAANVVGVPMGTFIGQWLGWRWTFALVGVIGLASTISIAIVLPRQPVPTGLQLRHELAAFTRLQVWLALSIVMFGFGGMFAFFTYVAPMLTDVTGYPPASVPLLLTLLGTGMVAGNLVGGWIADRALILGLHLCFGGLACALALFAMTMHSQLVAPVTLFLLGAAGFSAGPIAQTLILERAPQAPSMAAASVHSAFNVANALGAYFGGLVLAHGYGLIAPNWVGAGLACAGLALTALSALLARNAAAHAPPHTAADDPTSS